MKIIGDLIDAHPIISIVITFAIIYFIWIVWEVKHAENYNGENF